MHKNWIIDSGFSHRMLCDRRNFHKVVAYDGGKVKFDNLSSLVQKQHVTKKTTKICIYVTKISHVTNNN